MKIRDWIRMLLDKWFGWDWEKPKPKPQEPDGAPLVAQSSLMSRAEWWDRAPDVTMHKVVHTDGTRWEFRTRSISEIWGEHGAGDGTLIKADGSKKSVRVNGTLLRKSGRKLPRDGAIRDVFARPIKKWRTINGKEVFTGADGLAFEVVEAIQLNADKEGITAPIASGSAQVESWIPGTGQNPTK